MINRGDIADKIEAVSVRQLDIQFNCQHARFPILPFTTIHNYIQYTIHYGNPVSIGGN